MLSSFFYELPYTNDMVWGQHLCLQFKHNLQAPPASVCLFLTAGSLKSLFAYVQDLFYLQCLNSE